MAALVSFTAGVLAESPQGASTPALLDELARPSLATIDGSVKLPGLKRPVEIIRDQQGTPPNDDPFFAQGYVMAQDRLWQLEMGPPRRKKRLTEVFVPRAFDYDARARLMMFRGPRDAKGRTSYRRICPMLPPPEKPKTSCSRAFWWEPMWAIAKQIGTLQSSKDSRV